MTKDPFAKAKKAVIPLEWVMERLEGVMTEHKPMFGCRALYVGPKIVLILRDRPTETQDNGVWVATIAEYHASLRRDLPGLRSITVFGPGETGWQVIPKEHPEFERTVERVVALVRANDERIGKIPAAKRSKKLARAKKIEDEGITMADELPELTKKRPKAAPKKPATKRAASSKAARSRR